VGRKGTKARSYAANRATRTRWRAANPDKVAADIARWRAANPEKVAAYAQRWYAENRERSAASHARWLKANPDKVAAICARRRAAELRATPAWANHDLIYSFYRMAALFGLAVDHIIPLISKKVCGLHCEHNLQLLTKSENSRKGNRL
jgi:hypothetical protein